MQDARLLHLSYHDGDHYNSVRLADDLQDHIPKPVPAASCAAFSGTPAAEEAEEAAEEAAEDSKLQQVLAAAALLLTACWDLDLCLMLGRCPLKLFPASWLCLDVESQQMDPMLTSLGWQGPLCRP